MNAELIAKLTFNMHSLSEKTSFQMPGKTLALIQGVSDKIGKVNRQVLIHTAVEEFIKNHNLT